MSSHGRAKNTLSCLAWCPERNCALLQSLKQAMFLGEIGGAFVLWEISAQLAAFVSHCGALGDFFLSPSLGHWEGRKGNLSR